MAMTTEKLTPVEFERQYGRKKPYYELWRGEPVQKSMPTWLHGLLQRIVMDLLSEVGYKAGCEVRLKIDPEVQLIPDVVATRGRIELPYPTKPLEIVVEILSDDDPMSRILTKCRTYQSWGIREIYVVDPGTRSVFRWMDKRLEEAGTIALVSVDRIWSALDRELK
jgi:Uma2 family endonuclease